MRSWLTFIFITLVYLKGLGQESKQQQADDFLDTYSGIKTRKLTATELDSLLIKTDKLIGWGNSIDTLNLARIYLMKGDLQAQKLINKIKNQQPYLRSEVADMESSYDKSGQLDSATRCMCVGPEIKLYKLDTSVFSFEKYLSLEKKNMAPYCSVWDTHLGLGLSYLVPVNVLGAELCVWGGDKIGRKYVTDPKTSQKIYLESFEYPVGAALFSIGFEKSLSNSTYYAFKIDPIYTNTIFSPHPAQFLYAKNKNENAFNWRPELGVCFSSFAINYSYNLPFKKSFDVLPRNMITVRVVLSLFNFD